jgi:hypothetical protein
MKAYISDIVKLETGWSVLGPVAVLQIKKPLVSNGDKSGYDPYGFHSAVMTKLLQVLRIEPRFVGSEREDWIKI